MGRQWRFSLSPLASAGFTRQCGRKVQFCLDMLLLVALKIHVVLAPPLVRAFNHRSRLGLSVGLRLSASECLTSLADSVTCRVGGGALARWPPSAAQTARTVFPYAAFTMRRCYERQAMGLTE